MLPRERDEGYREYATESQWAYAEAWWRSGNTRAAAEEFGVHHTSVLRAIQAIEAKAARAGYAPQHGMIQTAPPGYAIRGTSTLYDADGTARLQWVKTKQDPDAMLMLAQEAAVSLAETLPRIKPSAAPSHTATALMAGYPIGDHHLGMYAWADEAGGSYDVGIAERLLDRAAAALVEAAPPADVALIAILGDFFHYDSLEPVTPTSKNLLDSDGRYAKMIAVGLRLARRVIETALGKHARVHVIVEPGNHDLSTSLFLAVALAALYEREPRVHVDTSPRHYHYYEFGKVLIGVHHGHGAKPAELPLIMASDQPEAWGRTRHKHWWTGHIHKGTKLDVQGVIVESFRVLPPTDAWAANRGYRGARNMTSIVYHREHGEVARNTICPEMLDAPETREAA